MSGQQLSGGGGEGSRASHSFVLISQDNTIDFLEFVAALNLVFRGDLEHKLRWSFKVYDEDNNGFVDRMELRSIIDVSLCWTEKQPLYWTVALHFLFCVYRQIYV